MTAGKAQAEWKADGLLQKAWQKPFKPLRRETAAGGKHPAEAGEAAAFCNRPGENLSSRCGGRRLPGGKHTAEAGEAGEAAAF